MSPRAVRGAMSRDLATRDIGEDDPMFLRPGKRSRPRTKDRPDYSSLPLARVITIDRGRYRCRVLDAPGHTGLLTVNATKARSLGRKAAIVGDVVRLDGDTSGATGTLARIAQVTERTTVLRRTADDTDPFERPIVANADQLLIVAALADPPPRIGMIDRVLVAGFDAGLQPVLCLAKADLASPDTLIALYQPLDVPIVVTDLESDLSEVRRVLQDHVTVLVGHSGVGKSTLVNRLIPGVNRTTGLVNDVTGRGRHTSTSAIALELPGGGWVIDTPGVRSFGLSHVTVDGVLRAFPDLRELTEGCSRGCTHGAEAPECALDEAVSSGRLAQQRLDSFRRMTAAR